MSLLRFEMKKLFLKPGALIFIFFLMLLLLAASVINAIYSRGGGTAEAQYEFARQYEGPFREDIAKKAEAEVGKYRNENSAGSGDNGTRNDPADITVYNEYLKSYKIVDSYLHGNIYENLLETYSMDGIASRLSQLEKEGDTASYAYKALTKKLSMLKEAGEPEYRYLLPWHLLLPAITAGGNLLFNVFLLIAITASVFSNEYSTGMDSIILSTKNGKSGVVTAKLTASIIFCSAYILLYNLTQLAVCLALGGTYGWDAPLKSMMTFLYTPFKLTMLQFFAAQLAVQMVGGIVIVLTVAFVSSRIRSSLVTFFISLGVVFYPLIIDGYFHTTAKWVQPILSFSLIQMVKAYGIFTDFKAYNIFGSPVLYPYLLIPLCIAFGVLMTILTYRSIKHREVC